MPELFSRVRHPVRRAFATASIRPQQAKIAAAHQRQSFGDQADGETAKGMGFPRRVVGHAPAEQAPGDPAIAQAFQMGVESAKNELQPRAALFGETVGRRRRFAPRDRAAQAERGVDTLLGEAVERDDRRQRRVVVRPADDQGAADPSCGAQRDVAALGRPQVADGAQRLQSYPAVAVRRRGGEDRQRRIVAPGPDDVGGVGAPGRVHRKIADPSFP